MKNSSCPGAASAGDTIIVTTSGGNDFDNVAFFTDCFVGLNVQVSGSAGINGDDAVELFQGGNVIDTYGDPDTNGDGETWDYTDGYAVRTGGSAGVFLQANYTSVFRGLNNEDEAMHKSTLATVFGLTAVPEPSSVLLLGLIGIMGVVRTRFRNSFC